MTMRICILETDILRPQLIEQYHGYGRMFRQLFEKQSIPAQFDVFNVVEGCYPDAAQGYDAYLITGSKADSFGTDPWIQTLREFLLERYDNGDRLIGICFGHQVLALLRGGKTARAAQGWGGYDPAESAKGMALATRALASGQDAAEGWIGVLIGSGRAARGGGGADARSCRPGAVCERAGDAFRAGARPCGAGVPRRAGRAACAELARGGHDA